MLSVFAQKKETFFDLKKTAFFKVQKNRIFFKGVNPCFWPKFDQDKPRNNAF